MGGWRVAIIDAADELNRFGANAILKTLEEPPSRAVLFLISHGEQMLLPTVRSRCRVLRCGPLTETETLQTLAQGGPPAARAEAVAKLAAGPSGPRPGARRWRRQPASDAVRRRVARTEQRRCARAVRSAQRHGEVRYGARGGDGDAARGAAAPRAQESDPVVAGDWASAAPRRHAHRHRSRSAEPGPRANVAAALGARSATAQCVEAADAVRHAREPARGAVCGGPAGRAGAREAAA